MVPGSRGADQDGRRNIVTRLTRRTHVIAGLACLSGFCLTAAGCTRSTEAPPASETTQGPESTPASQKAFVEANAVYRAGDPDAVAKAEAIVQAHMAAHPDLMAVAPAERAAAHAK